MSHTVAVDQEALKKFRRSRGLTQAELGEKAGYTKWAIAGIEQRGRAKITTVKHIAQALGVRVVDLLGFEEKSFPCASMIDSSSPSIRTGAVAGRCPIVIRVNTSFRITRCERLLSPVPPAALIGRDSFEFVHDDDKGRLERCLRDACDTRESRCCIFRGTLASGMPVVYGEWALPLVGKNRVVAYQKRLWVAADDGGDLRGLLRRQPLLAATAL